MTSADDKKARLAAELRANLHRRKAQARASADAAKGADAPHAPSMDADADDQPDR